MSNVITMKYGDYNISPVPLLNITQEFVKTSGGIIVGQLFKATFKGTLYSATGGLVSVDALQDELRDAFEDEGKILEIECDGNTIIKCRPRIIDIQFEESGDNWVFTTPYTLQLEWDITNTSTEGAFDNSFDDGFVIDGSQIFISDASEEWTIDFVDGKNRYELTTGVGNEKYPYQLNVTHSISATGKRHYIDSDGSYIEAWEQARNWVKAKLGWNSSVLQQTDVLNLQTNNFATYNHMREVKQDETGGIYGVTERWLVVSTEEVNNLGHAIEDFNVNIRISADSALTTVSIDGSVDGLEERDSSFEITTTKYDNAVAYFNSIKDSNRIYPRANTISGLTLNPVPLNKSVGHNPTEGRITYSYEYDNRPLNCITSPVASLSESITITDTNPFDVFASLVVLGRQNGPLLQSMNTYTARTREISVEVVMPVGNNCPSNMTLSESPSAAVYNSMIVGFYNELLSTYSQVFKHQDQESWNPKTGRYSRNIGWTFSNC